MKASLLIFISLLTITIGSAQMTASQLIEKSIKYHDPKGLLDKKTANFEFRETRPSGPDRKTNLMLHPAKEQFKLQRIADEKKIISTLHKGAYTHTVNNAPPTAEETDKYRLTEDRLSMMKNYYHYLWYMPMKLKDPGTIVAPSVKAKDFFGKSALEIKVTYDPSVGKDIWYFYFDPSSYALIGYRFYHDEVANDGEYILFEGEAIYKTIKLPQQRTWYTHKEDKILGTDILERISVR